MGCVQQGVGSAHGATASASNSRTPALLARPSSHTRERVASRQSDHHSIPYLVSAHVLAPGNRKLFSTDVSIKSHVLGEGIKGESPSPLSGCR